MNLPDARDLSVRARKVFGDTHPSEPIDVHVEQQHRLAPISELSEKVYVRDQLTKSR
ncbi:MAG: hypothetical protein ACRD1V_11055 [Vicinamibacterales bacterium]